jgi:hypothetical protein
MAGRGSLDIGTTVAGRHLNVWAFHGDADTALGIGGGLLPITGMLNAGANPAPIWTVYPGVGHSGCWDRAYRTDHTYHNPNVYEWFLSKRKPGTTAPAPLPTAPPVASAGADKTITLPSSSTNFTASATDPDGQITSYSWTKVSGPSATLANTTSSTLTVSNATTAGTYTFRVTVKDNTNLTDTDDVVLTVSSSAGTPPVANAGADKAITLPSSSASFTASATDADGTVVSYLWTKISGPSATLSNTTSKTLSVTNAKTAGTYVFRVTVKDNSNLTDTDDVTLTVNSTSNAPIANAGADKTITLPSSSASFTASATDADGTIASYLWTKISGPSATLSNTTSRTLSVSNATTAGTYTFRVTVKDNTGLLDTDDVVLIVNGTSSNQAPVVTAGEKKYITLPTNTASFTAVASDPDGSIVSYQWAKIGGGVITMSGTTSPTLYLKNALEGTYVFEVTVKDDKGATASAIVRLAVRAAVASLTPEATWEIISENNVAFATNLSPEEMMTNGNN